MHYTNNLFILLIGLTSLSITAQDSAPNDYIHYLESGKQCLMAGDSLCQNYFDKALEASRELDNDSIIGSVYIETYNAIKQVGGDYDKLISVLDQGISFLALSDAHGKKAMLYAEKGNTILDYGKQEDYMAYYDTAKTIALQGASDYVTSQIMVARARGLEVRGELDKCINELLLAREFSEKVGTSQAKAQIALGLSNAYYMNGDFELSKSQLETCQDLMLEAGDTLRYYYAKTNWCNVMLSLNRAEEVVEELPKSIAYFKAAGHAGLTPYPLTQLGRAYEMLDRPAEALDPLLASSEICQELGLATQFAYNQQILAHVYEDLGQKEEALRSAQTAYDHFKERGETTEFLDTSESLAAMLELNGRHKEANDIWKQYVKDKDSLYTDEKRQAIAEIQSLLDLEQKESQLCAQESEIAMLESEKQVARNRMMGLGGGLLLLGIIAWLAIKRKTALVQLKESKNQQLRMELSHQKRELTSNALHLAQKNEFLHNLKQELEDLKKQEGAKGVGDLMNKIKFDQQVDNNWDQFMTAFKESSPQLLKRLHEKHPELTKKEVQLCALARMGLSIKEISSMLHVTPDAVKKARYRLRKKIGLQSEESLEAYLQSLVS